MPAKRKLRIRTPVAAKSELPDWLRHYLESGQSCSPRNPLPADYCCTPDKPGSGFKCFDIDVSQAWAEHGEAVLRAWVRRYPGSRPWAWWGIEAPEPRQRLGGTGNGSDHLSYGVPAGWITKREAFYWKDETIAPMADAVEPSDPPRYESQAAYLVRLSLTVEGERARLGKSDFEPEVIKPKSKIPVVHKGRGFTGEYTIYED